MEDFQGRMEDTGWKTSGIYPEKNLGQAIRTQTPEQQSLIQIADSVYWWQWDTVSIGWKFDYKNINIDINNQK